MRHITVRREYQMSHTMHEVGDLFVTIFSNAQQVIDPGVRVICILVNFEQPYL